MLVFAARITPLTVDIARAYRRAEPYNGIYNHSFTLSDKCYFYEILLKS